jgi:archaellum component FlaF (FlaF/FlaG flagellin family)
VVPSFSYGAWGWRDPFPYYGIYGPYGAYAPVYTNAGEIVLKTNVKDADVFINGAYAGKAGKLKSMWLRADSYSLEIRAPGQPPFTERIYVVPGKTLKIHADFPSTPHS